MPPQPPGEQAGGVRLGSFSALPGSLSLSLSGPLFVSLFAGDGPLEPAAEPRGLTLGPAACCRELLQVFTLHFVTSRAPCLRPAWNWVTAAQHTLSLWEHLVL